VSLLLVDSQPLVRWQVFVDALNGYITNGHFDSFMHESGVESIMPKGKILH
jgi:hypothetical protein